MISDLLTLFDQRGASQYGGEAVTQLEHALQAAELAELQQAPASLIVAALLHDIGHLLHSLPNDSPDVGVDDCHETLGWRYLKSRFDDAVTEPVRLHVAAKRYLCATEKDYLNRLSPSSLISLELQSGPMSIEECAVFNNHAYAHQAVKLRRWDDEAKVPGHVSPPVTHFVRYLEEVVKGNDIQ